MSGRSKGQTVVRALAVVGVAVAPFAAIEADAAVQTGGARAEGPGIAVENSGGNREIGKGHSESKVTHGNKNGAPNAPGADAGAGALATPPPTVDPTAAKVAKAKALADAAKASAKAKADAAVAHAEQVVEEAKQQADDARSQGDAQSEEARARSSSYSSDD